ncbi:MAG: TIGR00303 family protein [Cyanobacteria bacterium REEB459]|nr:TIGR00303 family protein [Cyanobacteria bacterium REEB459]
MVAVHTHLQQGQRWQQQVRGQPPLLVLTLGFTATALIPGISAAGATPSDRAYTALADAEFMVNGPAPQPQFPLPPLQAGASPAVISRAVIQAQGIPLWVINAGLRQPPPVDHLSLGTLPAQCLSTGQALPLEQVYRLWRVGLSWGERLATQTSGYLILAECVVGGTTTALALLRALGIDALDRVNSSHPVCNHAQKRQVVNQGLARAGWPLADLHPLAWVAAIGDPMQPVVAGMALAASRTKPVMLAGGTQMLAVHALMQKLAAIEGYGWQPERVVVGTTRWVAEDPTGDTVGLAQLTQSCLMATQLSFQASRFKALQSYEQGFVKEGVGAGACAIAASLYQGWGQAQILAAVEAVLAAKAEAEARESG